jgi:hypothetical protein
LLLSFTGNFISGCKYRIEFYFCKYLFLFYFELYQNINQNFVFQPSKS